MATLEVRLTDDNTKRAIDLSLRTGRTPADLVNEAFRDFVAESPIATNGDWAQALLAVKGMWKDHDDVPDVRELRAGWDHRSQQPDP